MAVYMYDKEGKPHLFEDKKDIPKGLFDCPTKATLATQKKPAVKKEDK